jgi:hypothetical protein
MTWERVLTVSDIHDIPRRGVANFRDKPHLYQSQYSDAEDDYTDRFLLMEIESELFQLILEDWAIWLRWRAAFRDGVVSVDSHPALPEERRRHDEIKQIVDSWLSANPAKPILVAGEFRRVADAWEVQWRDVACNESMSPAAGT